MCEWCELITNEAMPLNWEVPSASGRVVTEMKYKSKNGGLFGWGIGFSIPLNFCPNCGADMREEESE